jgi:hypothetical protein
MMCATCKHIGRRYYGYSDNPIHHCAMGARRRTDQFCSCGDAAEDFMDEFRKFFDAQPRHNACKYYEDRPRCSPEVMALLCMSANNHGRIEVRYFSEENRIAETLDGSFLELDWYGRNTPIGYRAYSLSQIGKAELERIGDEKP